MKSRKRAKSECADSVPSRFRQKRSWRFCGSTTRIDGMVLLFGKKRKKKLGVYIHIPFCVKKCWYCDFYSVTSKNPGLYGRYIDALIAHMKQYKLAAGEYSVDSVYIGGGTPTVVPRDDMLRLIRAVKSVFHVTDDVEFTMEANPATVSTETLAEYFRAGVNRLSLGLQSASDAELSLLGRIHTRADFEKSYAAARDAGFRNINVDLMFGTPKQTFYTWKHSLSYVVSLKPRPTHISLYNLKLYDDDPKDSGFRTIDDLKSSLPPEETEFIMYDYAVRYLSSMGFDQVEISNFARRGYEPRHNLKYWRCEEYLGFGPGAHSYFDGIRFSYKKSVKNYIECNLNPECTDELIDECENITTRERLGEYVMLHMRLAEGIDAEQFYSTFGRSFESLCGDRLDEYLSGGFMRYNGRSYSFTTKGMFVSNYILSDILE
ncbi:MAG: radical SAM family heme chaperone HemW [Firmicutes bacterium]|nr:radical SAM family heme chaperone HemW [Bacillota bacterium]